MKQLSRAADSMGNTSLFLRVPSNRNTRLTELRCENCASFLAASDRPELLDFIQSVHHCKPLAGFPPRIQDSRAY